jgi:YbgC/YbaW family acyl-CoA thioester hydrolase
MSRIKIELPEVFSFSTSFNVRITDLNYGNHVGNDKVLSFLHEARVRFLNSLGYSELEMEGVSMIMADAALVFKNEMYYGDELMVSIQPVDFSRVGFDLIYKIEKKQDDRIIPLVAAKTAMVCFDYGLKKVVPLPEAAKNKLSA